MLCSNFSRSNITIFFCARIKTAISLIITMHHFGALLRFCAEILMRCDCKALQSKQIRVIFNGNTPQ